MIDRVLPLIIGPVGLIYGLIVLFNAKGLSRRQQRRAFLPQFMRRQMTPGLTGFTAVGFIVLGSVITVVGIISLG